MIIGIKEHPTKGAQADSLAVLVANELRDAIDQRGKASLAVPGGTTPGPFLTALSHEDLDWSKVTVSLTDERQVPEHSDRSNFRLLKTTLLQNKAAVATAIHLHQDGADVDALIDAILPLDVCVLGMGEDGHTASLFPGGDRLAEALNPETDARILPILAPGAPEARLSLTGPVLAGARQLHLLICGDGKRQALAKALEDGPVEDAPVRLVLQQPHMLVHFAPA